MTLTPQEITAIGEELEARLRKVAGNPATQPTDKAVDPIGPLDQWGSHEFEGQDGRFYTLDGWDRATTAQQRANIRTQLGLDENGNQVAAGPGPVGWEKGQKINSFYYPLFRDGGSDGLGGVKWVKVDGFNEPGRSPTYLFKRVRIRLRGADAIRAELEKNQPAQR